MAKYDHGGGCACGVMKECDCKESGKSGLYIGDKVKKITGDYKFNGTVVAKFTKLDGNVRYVVENPDGILHIYSGKNLSI